MNNLNYRRIHGLDIIKVSGTAAERAFQHGQILKERIQKGAIPFLAKKNEWLIRKGPGAMQIKPLQDTVVKFYNDLLLPMMEKSLPQAYIEILRNLPPQGQSPQYRDRITRLYPRDQRQKDYLTHHQKQYTNSQFRANVDRDNTW